MRCSGSLSNQSKDWYLSISTYMKWPWNKQQIAADPAKTDSPRKFTSLEEVGDARCQQIIDGLRAVMESKCDCSGCAKVTIGFRLTGKEYSSVLTPLGIAGRISYDALIPLIYKAARLAIRVPFVVLHEIPWSTNFMIVQNPAPNVECQAPFVDSKTCSERRVAEPTPGASVE